MSKSIPACHHTHPNGNRCGSPALRGEQFCFYHHPTRHAPTRARAGRTPFGIPAPIDSRSVQIGLAEVAMRLADNTLDPKRAGLMLITLQMAKANLSEASSYPSSAPRCSPSAGGDLSDLSELLAGLGLPLTPASPGL